ncbi:MAG: cysteine hydrolase family protein [Sciscionella sp.]
MTTMQALLVVDVQNDFCHGEGALARRGMPMDAMPAVAEANRRLAEVFRRAGRPVMFTRTEHDRWTDSSIWRMRIKEQGKDVDAIPVCASEWGRSFFGLAPEASDRVIVKHRYSAFHDTELDLVLRAKLITSICVTGVLTNVCVESTVRDGFMRDYASTVVPEACAAGTTAEHEMALRNIAEYFGNVTALTDMLADLGAAEPVSGAG